VHGERRPGSSPPTAATIAPNVTFIISNTLSAISGTTEIAESLRDVFVEHIAVPFSQDWLQRSVGAGYLGHSVLSQQSSPTKKVHVQSPKASPTKSSRPLPMPSTSLNAAEVWRMGQAISDPFGPTVGPTFFSPPAPTSPSLAPSPPSHNIFQQGHQSLPQQDALLSRDVIDFLYDIGHASSEDVDYVKHLYTKVGRDKWLPMLQTRFHLNNSTTQVLVKMLKKLDT
jgi:hypothetical protein